MTIRGSLALACAGLVATGAFAAAATAQPSTQEQQRRAEARPALALQAATKHVVLEKYGRYIYPDFGIYAVAGDEAFEIRAARASYRAAIRARAVTAAGPVALPAGLVNRWGGLPDFLHIRVTDSDGNVVVDKSQRFCPNGESVRVRPDAPDVSTYPFDCPTNPFTVGAVYGIDPGFAVAATDPYGRGVRLGLGRYTVTISVSKAYRQALGLVPSYTRATVTARVVKGDCTSRTSLGCKPARPAEQVRGLVPRKPAAAEPNPSGAVADPPLAVRPDLRSLPAYDIDLNRRGFLGFAATVWNAGPAPLVVDGFRTKPNLMAAYQYFYDADGTPHGYARAGGMQWDARHGHHHWHFRDFARYRLLDEDKNLVVRSRKEAFCLANTDAVDYTVPGANWRPYNTDLHTSCGDHTSVAVREVLDTGSGDTYYQSVAGQSFDIKDLPNGVYFISVEANPAGTMYEADTTNNNAYRKIILGGTDDDRTVRVPDVGVIHAP